MNKVTAGKLFQNEKKAYRYEKIEKNLISFVLAVLIFTASMAIPVGAEEANEKAGVNMIQPRVICINGCTSFSILVYRDDKKYDYTNTHGYGAFWSETCTVSHYTSRYFGYVCPECLYVQANGIDLNAYHDCYEIHSSCSRGQQIYCRGGKIM